MGKKNIFLFLILVGLLVFTYYYQELGQYYKQLQSNQQSALLKGDTSKISKMRFKDYSILIGDHGEHRVVGSGFPVSQEKLDQFLHQLSALKVQRKIPWDELAPRERAAIESEFNHRITFVFSDRQISYQLGAQTQFSQAFYMRVHRSDGPAAIFLCFNSAPRFEAYDPQDHVDTGPYLKVVGLFSALESSFHKLKLFTQFPLLTWAQIDNRRNRRFELLMEKFHTKPAIYQGLDYDQQEFELFFHRLRTLEAKRLWPAESALFEKDSTISWKGVSGGELSLFKRYGKREGYFVPHKDIVYELSAFSAAIFFHNVQDFWLKRPFGKSLDTKMALDFTLEYQGKRYSLQIPASPEFQVQVLNGAAQSGVRPRPKALQRLLLFVFGEDSNSGAQRVQEMTGIIGKTFAQNDPLILEIAGRKLSFLLVREEVLLWDQSTGLLFHYLVGPNFDLTFALSQFFDYSG